MLEGVDHRHSHFAFAQVAGHGFPQDFFRSRQVENIVHNLKRHAQIATVFCDLLFLLRGCAAEDRAHAHAHGKQTGGFPENEIEMLVERNQLAQLLHLQQFTLDHLLGEVDERVENAEVAFLHRNLESLHVQPVASKHAL